MSENDAAVYSTKQVADSLGLGAAMVRKYAVALEKLTGEDIPLKRRDGRQFDSSHFETISKAKALVDNHKGLNVETALKMALGDADSPKLAPALQSTDTNTLELAQAFSEAIERGNQPLLAELQELRKELRQSRQLQQTGGWVETAITAEESARLDRLQAEAERESGDSSQHGLLVQAAMWLEGFMRGNRQ